MKAARGRQRSLLHGIKGNMRLKAAGDG